MGFPSLCSSLETESSRCIDSNVHTQSWENCLAKAMRMGGTGRHQREIGQWIEGIAEWRDSYLGEGDWIIVKTLEKKVNNEKLG